LGDDPFPIRYRFKYTHMHEYNLSLLLLAASCGFTVGFSGFTCDFTIGDFTVGGFTASLASHGFVASRGFTPSLGFSVPVWLHFMRLHVISVTSRGFSDFT